MRECCQSPVASYSREKERVCVCGVGVGGGLGSCMAARAQSLEGRRRPQGHACVHAARPSLLIALKLCPLLDPAGQCPRQARTQAQMQVGSMHDATSSGFLVPDPEAGLTWNSGKAVSLERRSVTFCKRNACAGKHQHCCVCVCRAHIPCAELAAGHSAGRPTELAPSQIKHARRWRAVRQCMRDRHSFPHAPAQRRWT